MAAERLKKFIYLDYAATTPVLLEVVKAMEPYFSDEFGNSGSIHRMGQAAQKAIDDSREVVKNFIGASALREVIFTGSATEANNLAIFGVLKIGQHSILPHIITTQIEHESVLESCRALEKDGSAEVTYLKPDHDGLISAGQIRDALRPETVLVSVGYANNEIGVIQPIPEISQVIRAFRKPSKLYPLLHTDASQAAQFLDMNVENLGIDLMTLSAHKIYGPKGIGALYIREGIKLRPILYGGGQEYGLRSSTPNVPYIVGFAKALEILNKWKAAGGPKKASELKDYLLKGVLGGIPYASLNGHPDKRLPNNVNICLGSKTDGEALLIALSEAGVCVSSGAACSARSQKPSHVIQALGKSAREASASLRITLGRMTVKEEIDDFSAILFDNAKKFR